MTKRTKRGLMAAIVLILLGIHLFNITMTVNLWDFSKLQPVEYHTYERLIEEPFRSIYVQTEYSDITFLPSNDGTCKIVERQMMHEIHVIQVKDDTLIIDFYPIYALYETLGPTFGDPEITVYLPQTHYDSLEIIGGSVDISISQAFHFESLSISERCRLLPTPL